MILILLLLFCSISGQKDIAAAFSLHQVGRTNNNIAFQFHSTTSNNKVLLAGRIIQRRGRNNNNNNNLSHLLATPDPNQIETTTSPKIQAASLPTNEKDLSSSPSSIESSSSSSPTTTTTPTSQNKAAATNTINSRLLSEIENQTIQQKSPKTSLGKKASEIFSSSRTYKTDEEREIALAEARDLNGVNPIVALTASLFAFAFGYAAWTATNALGEAFVTHPVTSEVYFVQRLASVFRNLVMGFMSLASGFFGVTGMGLGALGVRVGYGVMKGELDPTPIKKTKSVGGGERGGEDIVLPNAWDLMMGKKPGRRGKR